MKSFLFILFIFFTGTILAGETRYSKRVDRSRIAVDDDYSVIFNPDATINDGLVEGTDFVWNRTAKVKLEYNREAQSDIDWNYQWRYRVELQFDDLPGTPTHWVEVTSELGADGYVYQDYALESIPAAFASGEIHVSVVSVEAEYFDGGWMTALSPGLDPRIPFDIHLEISVHAERYYLLDETESIRLTQEPFEQTIDVKWNFVQGAEEYELEWVYIDAKSQDYDDFLLTVSDPAYDPASPFELKESFSVRVNYNHYELDNAFDEGTVFFRIRPVGRFITGVGVDYSIPKRGKWSYHDTRSELGEPVTEPYLCYQVITPETVFEPNKTWAYSIGFSENGKFASGVSYFDGTNRGRQGTAYNSTDSVTMKSESVYDYEGRVVVALPPAPVHGRNLAYESGFNKTFGAEVLNKQHFDVSSPVTQLDSTSGISKYFSENNDFAQENQEAIPTAQGYVFGQVDYMNDGTGRVKTSSGAGKEFAYDSDHTIEYYYASPTSAELYRLFGSDVSGKTNFYRKVMTNDANGQYSVAYTDGAGRTIATALAGAPPNNLVELDGSVEEITTTLNESNYLTDGDFTLKSSQVFMNTYEGNTLSMVYDFTGIVYDMEGLCDPTDPVVLRCEDCIYNLRIVITNPNGISTLYEESISSDAFTCGDDVTYETLFSGVAILTLPDYTCADIGNYTITKELTLDITQMLEEFTAAIECEDKLDEITNEYLENVDISGCFTNCDDYCYYLVGRDLGYTEAELEIIRADPEDDFYSDPDVIAGVETCLAESCDLDEIFDGDADDIAEGDVGDLPLPLYIAQCNSYFSQMAEQISPGGYLFEADDALYWDELPADVTTLALFLDYDELGIGISGEEVTTLAELKDPENFREEWLETLVPFHREYCHYYLEGPDVYPCEELLESKEFDARFGAFVETTLGGGEWPETGTDPDTDGVEAAVAVLWGGTSPDPFVDLVFNEDDMGDFVLLQDALLDFEHPSSGASVNIFDYIMAISDGIDAIPGETFLSSETKWNLFQALYAAKKQELVDDYKSGLSPSCDYIDDDEAIFIGTDGPAGLDSDGDGEIEEDEISDYLSSEGVIDFFAPDVADVCENNVISWMDDLPPSCIALLETSGELDDLEAAFLDYCYEYCGPDNPGGWFFNHDPLGTYPSGTDDQYNAVMDILSGTCPDYEPSFETEAPSTEEIDGLVNQDFTACFFHLMNFVNDEIFPTDITADDDFAADYDIDGFHPLFNCGKAPTVGGAGVSRYWTPYPTSGSDPYTGFYEVEEDIGVGNPICSNIVKLEKLLGGLYDLRLVLNISNPFKVGVDTDPLTPGFEDGYIQVDITWDHDDNASTDPITEKGKLIIATCFEDPDWSNMTIITDLPGEFDLTYPDWETDCIEHIEEVARTNAFNDYNDLIIEAQNEFLNTIDCFTGIEEKFYMSYDLYEYQYTLFYYDQAGQLVQTIPPSGVDVVPGTAFTDGVWDETTEPDHKLETVYTYNGAGLLQESRTPDGGITKFYYDDLYRLRFVQNAKQLAENKYSYTKYDELGRPIEAGEAGDPTLTLPDLETEANNFKFPEDDIRDYTKTYYEEGFSEVGYADLGLEFESGQQNLRGAIGAVEKRMANYEIVGGDLVPVAGSEFRMVSSFSYDFHGNVDEMVQTNYYHQLEENRHKHFEYDYDLISGNVEEVIYQDGELDEWRHAYHYDAANRLIRVFTSDDGEEWEMDAKYFYYLHGSLARVEKGEDNVQGMDFAYTVQGWLKGVNSTFLDPTNDVGHDGLSTDLDAWSGADANGFSLGYYDEDYVTTSGTSYFANTDYLMTENGTYGELFNGNISTMVTAMKDENEALMTTQGNIYRYDLLQRIKGMDTYQVTDVANFNSTESFSAANATTSGMYATTYSFDKNGNITLLTRNDQAGAGMDNFTYNYVNPDENNQLAYVDDALTTAGITVDLEDQASGNYTYDAIGQLTKDVEAEIEDIQWTADGKVRKITFTSTSGKAPIQYVYDAGGNRLVQITGDPDDVSVIYEYYVYDATGNLMATYEQTHLGNLQGTAPADYTEITTLKDRNIYGASRLGSQIENRELYSRHFDLDGSSFLVNQNTVSTDTHTDEFDPTRRIMDTKFYEMSNHLGNVLNVVTDRKVGNVTKDGYEADIISYSDYYPYGMLLPGRSGKSSGAESYRYGFQGQEMDDEIKGEGNSVNYKYRMHDARIGRFFATDPLEAKYPHYTPYQFSGNKVIHKVELEGLEEGSPRGSVRTSYDPITGRTTIQMVYRRRPETHNYSLREYPSDPYNFSQFEEGQPLQSNEDLLRLGIGPVHMSLAYANHLKILYDREVASVRNNNGLYYMEQSQNESNWRLDQQDSEIFFSDAAYNFRKLSVQASGIGSLQIGAELAAGEILGALAINRVIASWYAYKAVLNGSMNAFRGSVSLGGQSTFIRNSFSKSYRSTKYHHAPFNGFEYGGKVYKKGQVYKADVFYMGTGTSGNLVGGKVVPGGFSMFTGTLNSLRPSPSTLMFGGSVFRNSFAIGLGGAITYDRYNRYINSGFSFNTD